MPYSPTKKLRRTVLGIVLGVIIIIIMPVAAVISVFSGDIEIDTDRLQQLVIEKMSDAEKVKLQTVENTMKAIEADMTEKGLPAEKAKEAQVLYVLALSDYAEQTDFASKLVGCFAEWAKQAYKKKWGYVYGTYGEVLTESILTAKASQYPERVGDNEEFIRSHWLGVRTADCIGLIKGYAWYNCDTGQIDYRSNGVMDMGSDPMLDMATEKGTIDTMPDIPGIAVWQDGHIGVYVGDGRTIHAADTELGVIMTCMAARKNHFLAAV